MKKFLYLLLLPALLLTTLTALTACEDNTGEEELAEFTFDWQNRNAKFFNERMDEAKTAIAEAKAAHGDDWAAHCDWRIFRSYAKMPGGNTADSICVKITERGTGSGHPLYTDSVRVNYVGRLMPTESYAEGRVFDHSGLYDTDDYVFNPDFCTPASFAVSLLIEGFTTALMQMRVGDRWRIYIPQELGYMNVTTTAIPAYSTLVFDLQLKGFYRAGTSTLNVAL